MPLADYRLVDTVAALLHTFVYPCATACTPRDLLASYASHSQWIRNGQKTCGGMGTDRHLHVHEPQRPDLGSQQPPAIVAKSQ